MRAPGKAREALLQPLFYAFPGGLPGLSLLLLRAVLGIALVVEGGFYVGGPAPTVETWLLGFAAMASGGLLLLGFLTPLAAILAGAGTAAFLLSLLPTCSPNLFDSKPAVIFALTMLLAITGAGPGRFSVDARMFGRREIIIPPASRASPLDS